MESLLEPLKVLAPHLYERDLLALRWRESCRIARPRITELQRAIEREVNVKAYKRRRHVTWLMRRDIEFFLDATSLVEWHRPGFYRVKMLLPLYCEVYEAAMRSPKLSVRLDGSGLYIRPRDALPSLPEDMPGWPKWDWDFDAEERSKGREKFYFFQYFLKRKGIVPLDYVFTYQLDGVDKEIPSYITPPKKYEDIERLNDFLDNLV